MNKFSILSFICLCFSFVAFTGCGKSIGVVDAGTYKGTIDKVVPEEEEIYVTLENGVRLELYFNEDTELVKGDEAVDFSTITQNASVEITVAREGNRNIPVRVVLL
ncbi:hypothetical protein DDZ13_13230 [Coraliomargarita sinensis]|uniref:DUF5666 domain-containing protein n=1 Tax=Coraliomargarita sinensis TaxID=2174842 RepID=A0A317ZIH6_9BACT|nr:hypothetical protein [Coraliomargarita sinensis]PXA03181.1 hypothetical protein DDZ13_13230 [Coraliomargarita sinensis]